MWFKILMFILNLNVASYGFILALDSKEKLEKWGGISLIVISLLNLIANNI